MYFSLIVFFVLFIPPVVILGGIKKNLQPYKTIYISIVAVSIAVIGVLAAARLSGMTLGEQFIAEATKVAEAIAGSEALSQQAGLGGLSYDDRVKLIVNLYASVSSLLPVAIIVITAIFSYFEYKYISMVFARAGKRPPYLIPARYLRWPPSLFLGFSIMFLVSWGAESLDMFSGMNILMNINILFEYVLAIQGIGAVLMLFELMKAPKILGIFAGLFGLLTGMGRIAFFFIGMLDMLFNIRERMPRR